MKVAGLFVGGCARTTKPLPVRTVKNLEGISGQWEGSAVSEKGKPFKFKVTNEFINSENILKFNFVIKLKIQEQNKMVEKN